MRLFLLIPLLLMAATLVAQPPGNRAEQKRQGMVDSTTSDSIDFKGERFAVEDSGRVFTQDSVEKAGEWLPDPKRAVRFALLLPGSGQVYNRDYWKAPIVWAALGATVTFSIIQHQEFTELREIYRTRTDSTYNGQDGRLATATPAIRNLRDQARRNRDLFFILTGVAYALQAVEAYVAAHLKGFDVSEDISLHLSPTLTPNFSRWNTADRPQNLLQPGLAFSLRLK